jgi:hypothetical protein
MGSYLRAFGLTMLVEVPVYAVGMRALLEVPLSRGVAAAVGVNVLTHPAAILVLLPALASRIAIVPALAATEAVVWAVEAAALRVSFRRDLAMLVGLSFVANGASLALGLVLLR